MFVDLTLEKQNGFGTAVQVIILIAKAARQDEIKNKQTQKHSTEGSVSDPSYFDMKACQFAIGAISRFSFII